ncbi:F0F1 ATP synthase subunit epsilon [Nitratireductor sp. GCM10026969]|uniref:F0F1 ATP synthase subunit epsilon n=1 Tax=Nitratireductor sp. GCM10026969 TaxID=3252645 RepID=UPI003606D992
MAEAFKFDLVSPERLLFSQDVDQVVIPGTEGEMTVLANHAPTMTNIRPGVIAISHGGREDRYVVFGGFADVLPEGCTLLAESAVHVNELNREDLARRIQEAREDVQDAEDHETRTRAEEFLDQLTTLEGAILPA